MPTTAFKSLPRERYKTPTISLIRRSPIFPSNNPVRPTRRESMQRTSILPLPVQLAIRILIPRFDEYGHRSLTCEMGNVRGRARSPGRH